MSCDPRTSKALVDALFVSGSMGLCLFDAKGRIASLEGAAAIWTPPVGASIEDGNLFVGMRETFDEIRKTGQSFLLSGVSMGSDDVRALDVRILWIEELQLFAALSNTATERNQLQMQISQIVRDNRLLEQKIKEQQEKIAEQAGLMELFIRHAPAAVAMLNSNLDIMMLSQRWIEDFGDPALVDDPDVQGSPLRAANINSALRLAMDTGVTSSRIEKIQQRGAFVWKRWEQTPWRRADRSVGGSILFVEDVTGEVRKSGRLRTQADELRKLHEELSILSAAVANGLREPLQRIEYLSAIARGKNDQAHASEKENRFGEISKSAHGMLDAISALQRYFLITPSDFVMTPFDLADAVELAARELQDDIKGAGAKIILHQMLSVDGDVKMMARVFRHLIDNSLKHAGGAPTITIDCHDEDGFVTVRFTDDGCGIPTHLHTRVFEPFGRIEERGAGPGDGFGLTECRKIVELHGGTMVIDASFDLGLRILINLPQRPLGAGLTGNGV